MEPNEMATVIAKALPTLHVGNLQLMQRDVSQYCRENNVTLDILAARELLDPKIGDVPHANDNSLSLQQEPLKRVDAKHAAQCFLGLKEVEMIAKLHAASYMTDYMAKFVLKDSGDVASTVGHMANKNSGTDRKQLKDALLYYAPGQEAVVSQLIRRFDTQLVDGMGLPPLG